jgi:hypothetical protein
MWGRKKKPEVVIHPELIAELDPTKTYVFRILHAESPKEVLYRIRAEYNKLPGPKPQVLFVVGNVDVFEPPLETLERAMALMEKTYGKT